ncbi:RsmE family RNA methyltransferase [Alicyclobacillus fastidiosus]|nr:16S rRNA (uracil(1498)-N(3))-methyltransferase [Alicyclobacillus fastidiosus]GMA60013.1 ribosomal RNA small subunit methyltransferase E [Alicyclobacillus fastidiosus]
MLPRVFVDAPGGASRVVTLAGDDGHHFARVLRVQNGEPLVVVTPTGPWLGEISAVAKDAVDVFLKEPYPSAEPRCEVVVVQGLAKGDKMETIVQKCTEVGASLFVLYGADRSVVKLAGKVEAKLARWQKVAREAAMQSQRDKVPVIRYESKLALVCESLIAEGVEQLVVLDEAEDAVGLTTALSKVPVEGDRRIKRALFVGPEGGWSEAERDYFASCEKACLVTLGRRILRTETAGVVGLAVTLAHFGDMGG